jgi:thioredoxin-related protein
MPSMGRLTALLLLASCYALVAPASAQSDLPPPIGAAEPRAEPVKGDDGIYHQPWFAHSLLNLKEEFEEARKAGKRFAVIFEQRGCIYCVKLHTETLAKRYVNDYARGHFHVVQLDLWGAREVVDLDGKEMAEKRLAERWGVMFTPTIIFYKESLEGLEGKFGTPVEVVRSNRVGEGEFYDMLVWVRHKLYEKDRNFQRFHVERFNAREALAKGAAGGAAKSQ